MKGFLYRLLITALGLWAASAIVPGVSFRNWQTLLLAALLLGIVNAVVRPILLFLTFPITILTLGLVAWLLPGFMLRGLGAAILGSIVVGLTSWLASAFVGGSGRIERFRRIEVRSPDR
jgi:putative membrane protein